MQQVEGNGCLDEGLLEELAERWRRCGLPVADRLQPGLAVDEIEATFGRLGLAATDDLKTWWGWHNGVADAARTRASFMSPSYRFYSLGDAVRFYERGREEAARFVERVELPPNAANEVWRPEWFCVTSGVGGQGVLADCSVDADQPTPIRMMDPHAERNGDVVATFKDMVQWWIDAFDCGAWSYDAATGWRHDWQRLDRERAASGLL